MLWNVLWAVLRSSIIELFEHSLIPLPALNREDRMTPSSHRCVSRPRALLWHPRSSPLIPALSLAFRALWGRWVCPVLVPSSPTRASISLAHVPHTHVGHQPGSQDTWTPYCTIVWFCVRCIWLSSGIVGSWRQAITC